MLSHVYPYLLSTQKESTYLSTFLLIELEPHLDDPTSGRSELKWYLSVTPFLPPTSSDPSSRDHLYSCFGIVLVRFVTVRVPKEGKTLTLG